MANIIEQSISGKHGLSSWQEAKGRQFPGEPNRKETRSWEIDRLAETIISIVLDDNIRAHVYFDDPSRQVSGLQFAGQVPCDGEDDARTAVVLPAIVETNPDKIGKALKDWSNRMGRSESWEEFVQAITRAYNDKDHGLQRVSLGDRWDIAARVTPISDILHNFGRKITQVFLIPKCDEVLVDMHSTDQSRQEAWFKRMLEPEHMSASITVDQRRDYQRTAFMAGPVWSRLGDAIDVDKLKTAASGYRVIDGDDLYTIKELGEEYFTERDQPTSYGYTKDDGLPPEAFRADFFLVPKQQDGEQPTHYVGVKRAGDEILLKVYLSKQQVEQAKQEFITAHMPVIEPLVDSMLAKAMIQKDGDIALTNLIDHVIGGIYAEGSNQKGPGWCKRASSHVLGAAIAYTASKSPDRFHAELAHLQQQAEQHEGWTTSARFFGA